MKTTILLKPAGGGKVKLMATLHDADCSYSESLMTTMDGLDDVITGLIHRSAVWLRARGADGIAISLDGLSCNIAGDTVTAHWPMRGTLCMARVPYAAQAPLAAVGMAIQETLNSVLQSADGREDSR